LDGLVEEGLEEDESAVNYGEAEDEGDL
jgi:hypothetical protein